MFWCNTIVSFSIYMGTLIALPFIGDIQATRAFAERFEPQDKSAEVTKKHKKWSFLRLFLCVLLCVFLRDRYLGLHCL
jgi:hypothetical protein